MAFRPGRIVVRFIREDSGQDLVEYALLTGIVTVGSLAIFASIRGKMGAAYLNWQSTGQTNWVPNPPLP